MRVFKHNDVQAQFERDGLITLPLLNADEVAALQQFYNEQTTERKEGFHASMFHQSEAYRRAVDARIKQALGDKLKDVLIDYKPLYANFMVKEPGVASEMKVHQDWAYVDETQYTSLAIWFPLIDLDHNNGCLYFLKGGHTIVNEVRGPGTVCPYEHIQQPVKEKYLTAVPLKAGEAVIWHHRLVHCSPPNMGDQTRVACTAILTPEGAPVYHFFRREDMPLNEADKYAVDGDFYMNYDIANGPASNLLVGRVTYPVLTLDEAGLQAHGIKPVKPEPITRSGGLFTRIKAVFTN